MRVRDGEPIGLALRRFKKLVERSGIRREAREHSCHVPPAHVRGTKKFLKRLKARLATLDAQKAGRQPCASLADAVKTCRQRGGKK
jgi:small subunit ribosomal protein S21